MGAVQVHVAPLAAGRPRFSQHREPRLKIGPMGCNRPPLCLCRLEIPVPILLQLPPAAASADNDGFTDDGDASRRVRRQTRARIPSLSIGTPSPGHVPLADWLYPAAASSGPDAGGREVRCRAAAGNSSGPAACDGGPGGRAGRCQQQRRRSGARRRRRPCVRHVCGAAAAAGSPAFWAEAPVRDPPHQRVPQPPLPAR